MNFYHCYNWLLVLLQSIDTFSTLGNISDTESSKPVAFRQAKYTCDHHFMDYTKNLLGVNIGLLSKYLPSFSPNHIEIVQNMCTDCYVHVLFKYIDKT